MNRIIGLVLLSLILTVGNAQAHCGKCGIGDDHSKADMGKMVSEKVDAMAKDLGLTDEQKSKVEAMIKDKMDKKESIMADKHKAMEALHEDFHNKLKGVLTEEQLKKWEDAKMGEMKTKCPMCEKEGKMCKMCMMKNKDRKGDDHDHEHKE